MDESLNCNDLKEAAVSSSHSPVGKLERVQKLSGITLSGSLFRAMQCVGVNGRGAFEAAAACVIEALTPEVNAPLSALAILFNTNKVCGLREG